MTNIPQPAEAFTVRPGQTLILRYERPLSAHEIDQIKTKLTEWLPGVETLIISGCQQLAAYDPGQACGNCGGTHVTANPNGYYCSDCGWWKAKT